MHIQISISQYSHVDNSHEFVGTALARFERSTLPEHKGTRTVVLRFLKIITPVRCVFPLYDGCPKEGELHRILRRIPKNASKKAVDQTVWSLNIDRPKISQRSMRQSLQLLCDA